MERKYVIDAGALMIHFAGDARVKPFIDEIFSGEAVGSMCEVNLAEYYYKTCQKLGKAIADIRYRQIRGSKIMCTPTNEKLVQIAGQKKCVYKERLSLADCFALALAEEERATLLTTDSELAKVKEIKANLFEL